MRILDVISEEQALALLEDHDTYHVGKVGRRRLDISLVPGKGWFIYLDSCEVYHSLENTPEPRAFRTLLECLEQAFSPRNWERWEELDKATSGQG